MSAKGQYVREILELYRQTPGTRGRVRPADRRLAEQLYDQGISVELLRAALLLAASRRIFRDPSLPPLEAIGSLHYFLPVLEEVQRRNIDPEYLEYVQDSLARAVGGHQCP